MRRLQVKGNGTVLHTEVLMISQGKDLGESFDRPSASSSGRIQVGRHVKGNQEWNNELQTKANELERLFASQKLRVRGDRIVSDHGGKTPDSRFLGAPATPVESVIVDNIHSEMGFHGNCEMGFANNQNRSYRLNDGGMTDNIEFRGKFYGRYMKMRDAKLIEEWRLERDTKEAKLKALQDRLDQCWAEMKATKFFGSVEKHDSSILACRRAEMLRALLDRDRKSDKQDIVQNHDDDYRGEIDLNQNRSVGETSADNGSSIAAISKRKLSETSNDGSSKGAISKKIASSSKNIPSLASVKASAQLVMPSSRPASVAGTRRQQPEQSSMSIKLPDLRKQVAKPLTGIGKEAHRTQPGKYNRNVGSYGDKSQAKEQKPHRSQVKKNSVSPVDCGVSSPRKLDNPPTKLSREDPGHSRVQKAVRPKSFLRKGRGKEPSGENCVLEQPASVTPTNTGDGDSKGSSYDVEDQSIIDKADQQVDILSAEVDSRSDSVHSNCVEPDIDNALILSPRVEGEPFSSPVVTEFNLERSISLSSNGVFDTFSCVQDESDIVASMLPSIDTPSSPQVHPLNWMTGTGSTRSRRWVSADEPTFVDNAPRQARKKDVTSGLKWLLRIGRRRKGAESATHSGRGYDTEDPCQQMNQLTDDTRKSRMDFAQHHSFHGSTAADDGFNRRGPTHGEGTWK